LPNVGKSTLFNALLKKQQAKISNYPFATIEPNVGVVPVVDKRLGDLVSVIEKTTGVVPPQVPAVVVFTDIAGLVKGASKGEGLGNQFLSHIRQTSVIVHVVRAFKDSHVVDTGMGDFGEDLSVVKTELALSDLDTLGRQKEVRGTTDKSEIKRWSTIVKVKSMLEIGQPLDGKLSSDELDSIYNLHLLSTKPSIYVVNVSENELGKKGLKKKYSDMIGVSVDDTVIVCAKTEAELSELALVEQKEYLKSLNIKYSGLENLVTSAYKKLNLISFLTAREKEVRAWTIPSGTRAKKASGVIHEDFEKLFIKAQVSDFDDFISNNGWNYLKEKGMVRFEGKDYVVKDGDVIEFMIGK